MGDDFWPFKEYKMKKADVVNDRVFNALNPAGKRFLHVRQLSDRLNPFLEPYEIGMYALTLYNAPHIKTIATVQMMLEDFENGLYDGMHTLVVPSSGNTVHAAARLAPAFGFQVVRAVVPSDITSSKKGMIDKLPRVKLVAVGGGMSVQQEALALAQMPGHYLLDQYKHEGNLRAHERHTGPEMLRCISRDIAVVAIAMGSGGTVAGVGKFLKSVRPNVVMLGVRPAPGEQVPGTRDKRRMEERVDGNPTITIPWQEYVDHVIEVDRKTAFRGARQLWLEVEPQPGPSSGLAWRGLMKYLAGLERSDWEKLRGKNVLFLCPDDCRLYIELFASELDTGQGAEYSI